MAVSPDAVIPSGAGFDVGRARQGARGPQQLADILERVLDKGIVIAGDIQVRLLDIELLTIKLRLVIASLERAHAMGIDWWEGDPFLSTRAQARELPRARRRSRQKNEATAFPTREALERRRALPAARAVTRKRTTRSAPKKSSKAPRK